MSLQEFYSYWYRREKQHSPDVSQISLRRRAQPYIQSMGTGSIVLNIGAGRQVFEKLYTMLFREPPCAMVTLDLATLENRQLIAKPGGNIHHVQADGNRLPFNNCAIDLVISNMALDFMSEDAISEVARVIKPNGRVFTNLCFPALDLNNAPTISELHNLKRLGWHMSRLRKHEFNFFRQYLAKNKVLFNSPTQAQSLFESHGFQVVHNSGIVGTKYEYGWCELDAVF